MSNGHHHDEQDDIAQPEGPIVLEDANQRAVREQAEAAGRQERREQLIADSQRTQATASKVIALLTFALVVVSLISGFVSFLQFRAAKDSADAARQSALPR